jgi:glycerate kinase
MDGGCGMAAALGTVFYNGFGKVFLPVGEKHSDIKSIDPANTGGLLCGISITALTDVANHKADGIGKGVVTFLKGSLESGTSYLIRMSGIENELKSADLVITGEGSFASQNLEGKITGAITSLGEKHNVPVLVLCGQNDYPEFNIKKGHIISINPENMPLHIAIKETRNNLRHTISELIKEDII